MSTEFDKWWNEDLLTEDNPFVDGTPAYWAWEGWCAAVKAEREACARVCDTEWNGDSDTYEYTSACNECAAAIRSRSSEH